MTLTEHWHELVTASLLGTDRREPPDPPEGPLADVLADALDTTPSARMLTSVAASVAARRAGLRPAAPATPLAAPAGDDRPLLPHAAGRRWWEIVGEWPVLEDEWLVVAWGAGWRLPPDVLVGMLRRHRPGSPRRDLVMRLAGPLGPWLLDHLPELGRPTGRRPVPPAPGDEAGLPVLPVPPDLVPLLDAVPGAVVAAVAGGLDDGGFGASHRAVLVNLVARVRPAVLAPLAAALTGDDVARPGSATAHWLADLATTRAAMLAELAP